MLQRPFCGVILTIWHFRRRGQSGGNSYTLTKLVRSHITIVNNYFIVWLRLTMGATRAEKQLYFEKLKELLAKYRPYSPDLRSHPN